MTSSSARSMGRPTTEGKVNRGMLSPAKPALMYCRGHPGRCVQVSAVDPSVVRRELTHALTPVPLSTMTEGSILKETEPGSPTIACIDGKGGGHPVRQQLPR